MVPKISIKEVTKPESSGLTGAERMFESDEEDIEVQEQIAAALEMVDPLDELKLSETSSSSESSSEDDDKKVDLNETKQYYRGLEAEGTGKSETKPSNSKPTTTGEPPAVPDDSGHPGDPGPDIASSGDNPPAKPTATKGKGPNSEKSGKAPAPKQQLSAVAEGVWERARSPLSLEGLP